MSKWVCPLVCGSGRDALGCLRVVSQARLPQADSDAQRGKKAFETRLLLKISTLSLSKE